MKIIGWVREGDKAACDGIVLEGDKRFRSNGLAYAYQGARMTCAKNCIIAEGYAQSTLIGIGHRVLHGMKTSGGCPLLSTLNDIDGVHSTSDKALTSRYVLDAAGAWIAAEPARPHNTAYDEQPRLVSASSDGMPYFIETTDGRKFSGRTGADGLLPRIDTDDEDEYTVYWGDEALARQNQGQENG